MSMLSSLRTPAVSGIRSALCNSAKGKVTPNNVVQVRQGGGGHKMVIKPSTYNRDRFKDDLYFYLALGIMPIGAFITYQNVRHGPAELREIPEDYVPEHWEYYRDPVRRFMAKHFFTLSHEKEYERTVYYLWKENESRKDMLKMKKVKEHLKSVPTQREWYYVPESLGDRRRYDDEVAERQARGLNVQKWV